MAGEITTTLPKLETPVLRADGISPDITDSLLPRANMGLMSPYTGADPFQLGGNILSWNPLKRSADAQVMVSRDVAQDRARDLQNNNEWISGALERKADAVVGASLRLASKPNWRALGIFTSDEAGEAWADEFAAEAEAIFNFWGNDIGRYCDTERHYTFGQLMRMAYINAERDGEVFAIIRHLPERSWAWGTTVQIIDPDRVTRPDWIVDDDRQRGGIAFDQFGAETGFYVSERHPADFNHGPFHQPLRDWAFVPRETPWGRPVGVHWFNKHRSQQHRGISRLVSAMERVKRLEKLDRSELEAAANAAVLAMYAKSNMDAKTFRGAIAGDTQLSESALEAQRLAFYAENPLNANGTRIPVLPRGDEIAIETGGREGRGYEGYHWAGMRGLASSLNTTTESLSMDFSKGNYSGIRAGFVEIWRSIMGERHAFGQALPTPAFSCVVEEAVATGRLKLPNGAPSFDVARSAYCQCEWYGPARGFVDPDHEIDAAGKRVQLNQSTLEIECAEQGLDYREVIRQRGKEKKLEEAAGVLPPEPGAVGQQGGVRYKPPGQGSTQE